MYRNANFNKCVVKIKILIINILFTVDKKIFYISLRPKLI